MIPFILRGFKLEQYRDLRIETKTISLQTIHQQIVDVKSSSQVAMVLVGNKCDMEMDREVSKEQVSLIKYISSSIIHFRFSHPIIFYERLIIISN